MAISDYDYEDRDDDGLDAYGYPVQDDEEEDEEMRKRIAETDARIAHRRREKETALERQWNDRREATASSQEATKRNCVRSFNDTRKEVIAVRELLNGTKEWHRFGTRPMFHLVPIRRGRFPEPYLWKSLANARARIKAADRLSVRERREEVRKTAYGLGALIVHGLNYFVAYDMLRSLCDWWYQPLTKETRYLSRNGRYLDVIGLDIIKHCLLEGYWREVSSARQWNPSLRQIINEAEGRKTFMRAVLGFLAKREEDVVYHSDLLRALPDWKTVYRSKKQVITHLNDLMESAGARVRRNRVRGRFWDFG